MSAPDVALVGMYPPPGELHSGHSGVASYTANLAHALRDQGASVTVVASDEGHGPGYGIDRGIHVLRPFRRGPGALSVATAAAETTGAPVVHVQHEMFLYGGVASIPGVIPALRRHRRRPQRRRRPLVVTMHQVVDPATVDGSFTQLHRVRAPAPLARLGLATVQRLLREHADAVIVHEPAFTNSIPDARVVPHGVELATPATRAAARAALGLHDGFVVLCFGFLAPYKGLETALAAAQLAGRSVQLVVAGGEHPRLSGRDRYASMLRDRWGHIARFTGRVPDGDVPLWFSAADVALYPYPRPFSSSGALALALAYRTPVLLSPELTRCTGAPSALTAPRDASGLAMRLRDLAEKPGALEILRSAAASLGEKRAWPRVAAHHLDLYGEVIDAHGPTRRRLRPAQPR